MLRALIFMAFFPLMAAAQDLPRALSETVSDYAELLDAPTEARISQALMAARASYGSHIALAIINDKASYGGAGQSIESYGKALFNAWGLGDKDRQDGILILMVVQDREVRIALGRGFDAVYDGYAQRVIDSVMLPAFRDNRYPQGLEDGVQGVVERLAVPFFNHQTPAPITSQNGWFAGIFAAIGAVGVVAAGFWSKIALAVKRCPNCGQRSLQRDRQVAQGAGLDQSGVGIETTRCSNCDYQSRTEFKVAPKRSGKSSGGFGGGSSSGGGATGRW